MYFPTAILSKIPDLREWGLEQFTRICTGYGSARFFVARLVEPAKSFFGIMVSNIYKNRGGKIVVLTDVVPFWDNFGTRLRHVWDILGTRVGYV